MKICVEIVLFFLPLPYKIESKVSEKNGDSLNCRNFLISGIDYNHITWIFAFNITSES